MGACGDEKRGRPLVASVSTCGKHISMSTKTEGEDMDAVLSVSRRSRCLTIITTSLTRSPAPQQYKIEGAHPIFMRAS